MGDGPEQNALFAPGTAEFLTMIERLPDAELATQETRGRRKLIARALHPFAPIRRLCPDRTEAAAYGLTPQDARKILARVAQASGLVDGIFAPLMTLLLGNRCPRWCVSWIVRRFGCWCVGCAAA